MKLRIHSSQRRKFSKNIDHRYSYNASAFAQVILFSFFFHLYKGNNFYQIKGSKFNFLEQEILCTTIIKHDNYGKINTVSMSVKST